MSNKSGNNGKDNTAYKDIIEQFPDHEKERVEKIWEITPDAASREPGVSEMDVEQALSAVHARIRQETDGQNADHFTANGNGNRLWKWIAAAAVIILGMGTGILFIPQTTTAPNGELVTVELPDGSSVELNSGSQIRHNRLFAFSNRTLHLEGEAFFSVENGSPPFIVNANNSAIEVTGTEFNVRSWSEDPSGETEVTVSEGSVQFYPVGKPDSAVTISPGNLSKLTAKMTKPTIPEPITIDRIIGWRNHQLIFNNKPLVVIFRELERRFDVRITLEDKTAAGETLTTYYAEPQNVKSVLEDICRVKGLRYSETANGYRVYR